MIVRLLAFVLFLLASPAMALQVAVRSGEHDGFSRLVFLTPSKTKWSLTETGNDFRINFERQDLTFDLTNVFRYIPKDRIKSVSETDAGSSVMIEAGADIQAKAFQLSSGAVVIDFITAAKPDLLKAVSLPKKSDWIPPLSESYMNLYWRAQARHENAPAPEAQPRATTISLPDPRVQLAESELMGQLARAASQGLIKLDLPETQSRPSSVQQEPASETAALPALPSQAKDHIAIRSQTAIDRDAFSTGPSDDLTGRGERCYPDTLFSLTDWLDASAPTAQIGKARQELVGEFDIPNPGAAADLAKIYLALSFGAEAWQLAQTMDANSDETEAIKFMASVIESNPVSLQSPILAMAHCDSDVAMWALLGAPDDNMPETVRFGAVQRAFSALPYTHRKLFGPTLVRKLIVLGAPDVAQSVRAALARAPENSGASMKLMDARIEIAAGAPSKAEEHLKPVIAENTAHSSEAVVLYVEERLRRGEPVDDATTENAGALAFELKDTREGLTLRRAHVLGLGSVGRFSDAFSALEHWPEARQRALREKTVSELYALLASVPDDQLFLTTYYAQEPQALQNNLQQSQRSALAARLIQLGFAVSARKILGHEALKSEQGRILLARAALTERDAPAALAHLSEVTDHAAGELRGKALQMLGEHAAAKNEFLKVGDVAAETTEAWRSGDWPTIAASGSAAKKDFLAAFDLHSDETALPESEDPGPMGMLARSRALIEKSRTQRETLDILLNELKILP